MTHTDLQCPISASNGFINHLAYLGAVALSYLLLLNWPQLIVNTPALFILFFAVPIALYEVFDHKVFLRTSAGLSSRPVNKFNPVRLFFKYIGISLTLGVIAALYWIFPEYHKEQYLPFYDHVKIWLPWILGLSAVYMAIADLYMKEPEDIYFQIGRVCTGKLNINRDMLANHARSWIIRAFFLPIMFGFLLGDINFVLRFDLFGDITFKAGFDLIYNWILIGDLVAVVIGYAIAARILDNNIISTDSTVKGWVVCIICYPPLWSTLFYASYFSYAERPDWHYWFQDLNTGKYIWAGLIIILMSLYASASIAFGLRWSNLTYRGIITSGVYKITKHPAYVFKNITWWIMAMPFMLAPNSTWLMSLRDCLMVLGINFIYYLRAKTEEEHLSRYPEYEQYALWMEQHGWLRFMGRILPFLKYKPRHAISSESHA